MAEEVKKEVKAEVKEVKKSFRFFKCKEFANLKIVIDANVIDPTTIVAERFTPIAEKYQGDEIKVGYLRTENPVVIAKCEADPYVEEIEEKDFPELLNR